MAAEEVQTLMNLTQINNNSSGNKRSVTIMYQIKELSPFIIKIGISKYMRPIIIINAVAIIE